MNGALQKLFVRLLPYSTVGEFTQRARRAPEVEWAASAGALFCVFLTVASVSMEQEFHALWPPLLLES